VRQLLAEGLIHDEADLFTLQAEDLIDLEGFAEKKVENLLASIEAAKSRPLPRLIGSLGIRGVGTTNAALLVEHFPSLDALAEATHEDLESIEGMGPLTAAGIRNWFEQPHNRQLVEKFRQAGVQLVAQETTQTSAALDGLTFVITGTLPTLSRNEAKALIEDYGGRVTGSVSQKTSYLVVGDSPGSKFDKAQKLNVPTLDEEALRDLIESRS
jgi:DNA ligase (NAD+)